MFVLIATALVVFAGVSPTPSAAAPLQLVTDQWVPYENLSDAAAPGFSTEVLRGVFAAMKQEVSFEEFPWARAGDPMASLLSRVGVRFDQVAPEFAAAFEPAPKRRRPKKSR